MAVTRTVDGTPTELYVCEACGRKEALGPSGAPPVEGASHSLTDVLFRLGMPLTPGSGTVEDAVCPVCGLSRGELRARHRLGCPHCYRVFQNDVRTFISSQIPVSERAGRTPADAQTARELSALQKKLEQAIADEHYEEACKIAHEIQQLRRDLETPEA